MARAQIRADVRKISSIKDLAGLSPLPQLSGAKNKTYDFEDHLARLEDQKRCCRPVSAMLLICGLIW